jgi:hypothetical protein
MLQGDYEQCDLPSDRNVPRLDGEMPVTFMQQIQRRKFSPSKMSAPYRTFCLPMHVKYRTEFPGSDGIFD